MNNILYKLTASSVLLPGIGGKDCLTISDAINYLDTEMSCLVPYPAHNSLVGTMVGRLQTNFSERLQLSEKEIRYYSRAALMGAVTVKNLLDNLGGRANSIIPNRTLLIVASLQFAASDVCKLSTQHLHGNASDTGLEYWNYGTPASVVGGISMLLKLDYITLNIAGSCNVGLRAVEVGLDALACGRCDRVIVLGLDSCLDDLFLAGALHTSRKGYRAAVNVMTPGSVRPHDVEPLGNASGEGAVAIVLERSKPETPGIEFAIASGTIRSSGITTIASGSTGALSRLVFNLLCEAGVGLADLAFMVDYADGNRFVEDHFCNFLTQIREETGEKNELIRLVNPEANFGHIAGPSGVLRLLLALELLSRRTTTNCANVRKIYPLLGRVAVRKEHIDQRRAISLVVSSGAGGDATAALVEVLNGRQ